MAGIPTQSLHRLLTADYSLLVRIQRKSICEPAYFPARTYGRWSCSLKAAISVFCYRPANRDVLIYFVGHRIGPMGTILVLETHYQSFKLPNTCTMESMPKWPVTDAVLVVVALTSFLLLFNRQHKPKLALPGPKGLFFIGNTFQIPKDRQWLLFDKWIHRYGSFTSIVT